MAQPSSQPNVEECINRYLRAVRHLPFVQQVLVDESGGLSIYTLYEGDLASIARNLFGAEAEVLRAFPQVRVRFEPRRVECTGLLVPAESASVVYTRR